MCLPAGLYSPRLPRLLLWPFAIPARVPPWSHARRATVLPRTRCLAPLASAAHPCPVGARPVPPSVRSRRAARLVRLVPRVSGCRVLSVWSWLSVTCLGIAACGRVAALPVLPMPSAQGAGLRVKLLSMLLSCCALSCCAMSRVALRASVTLLLARVAPYLPTTPVNRKICYAYYGIPQIVAGFIL